MMKANKLMVDDWVMLNGSPYRVMDIKKKGVIKLYDTIGGGLHPIEMNTDWIEEFLEPVPLTREIMEKNGFEKIDSTHYYILKLGEYSYNNSIILYFPEDSVAGGMANIHNEHGEFCGNYGNCNFVHELQHILNDKDIEKDIVV